MVNPEAKKPPPSSPRVSRALRAPWLVMRHGGFWRWPKTNHGKTCRNQTWTLGNLGIHLYDLTQFFDIFFQQKDEDDTADFLSGNLRFRTSKYPTVILTQTIYSINLSFFFHWTFDSNFRLNIWTPKLCQGFAKVVVVESPHFSWHFFLAHLNGRPASTGERTTVRAWTSRWRPPRAPLQPRRMESKKSSERRIPTIRAMKNMYVYIYI